MGSPDFEHVANPAPGRGLEMGPSTFPATAKNAAPVEDARTNPEIDSGLIGHWTLQRPRQLRVFSDAGDYL